jgi:hypothetical protein|tara:strand:+ start:1052 stop:1465 length:414 start_codon:yes stop_codon:yes gene_type:complete
MAEAMNGQRPPMPSMAGANMEPQPRADIGPGMGLPEDVKKAVMQPDPEIGAVIMARLGSMSEEQLDMLDRAITPEAAQALLMILPELGSLIDAIEDVEGAGEAMMPQAAPAPRPAPRPAPQAPRPAPQAGALGNMGR